MFFFVFGFLTSSISDVIWPLYTTMNISIYSIIIRLSSRSQRFFFGNTMKKPFICSISLESTGKVHTNILYCSDWVERLHTQVLYVKKMNSDDKLLINCHVYLITMQAVRTDFEVIFTVEIFHLQCNYYIKFSLCASAMLKSMAK